MIIIHEGVPGSGKSYDGVRKIIDALKRGRVVYTNIDGMQNDSCLEYLASRLGISRDALALQLIFLPNSVIPEFWNHVEPGGFIVIDEAQLYFNSRDFIKTANREFGDWSSTHRHHGFDLLLITQRAERIDTSVRSLAEFRYRYRKLNVFGSLVQKSYLIYTYAGEDPKHLAMRKATYDVSIFPCYQSYVGDATEKKIIKLPNLLNHPIFYSLAIVLFGVFYFGKDSPLLHGKLINTPVADAAVLAMKSKKSDISKLPLVKQETSPPLAGEGSLAPSAPVGDDIIVVVLDAVIEMSDRVLLTSKGQRLGNIVSYNRDMMTAYVLRSELPAGLMVN